MARRWFAALLVAVSVYLLWAIVVAIDAESLFTAGPRISQDPWTWVTIVDLYLGFLVVGGAIVLRERRARRYLPWLVALFCLGNLASAAYLIAALWRPGSPETIAD
ncbi:MAG: DUF1475 family protein [Acidobacteria bacterium]|nr:DUF1475 family protein [Acidobacteriota bacterium]